MLGASVAAVAVATGPVAVGTFITPFEKLSATISDSERSTYASHASKHNAKEAIRANRALQRRCSVLGYRLRHLPYCPAPETAAGKTLLARQMLAYA